MPSKRTGRLKRRRTRLGPLGQTRRQLPLQRMRRKPRLPALPSQLRILRHVRPSLVMRLTSSRPASKRSRWLRNSRKKRVQRWKRQPRRQNPQPRRMLQSTPLCRRPALITLRFNNRVLQTRSSPRTVFHRRYLSPEVARRHLRDLRPNLKLPLQTSLSNISRRGPPQTSLVRRNLSHGFPQTPRQRPARPNKRLQSWTRLPRR